MPGLRAALAFDDQEGHPLPLGDHAAGHDGGAVHEDVGAAAVRRREAVPLARLVPVDGAEQAHGAAGGRIGGDANAQRLGPAVVLADLEHDGLTLAEHFRAAVPDDLGGVHEHVRRAVLGREEAETTFGVEPTDGPLRHQRLQVERAGSGPQSL